MSFRGNATSCGAGTALALALTLATTLSASAAAADELPGVSPAYTASNDMPLPAAPDMRPEWRPGASSAALLPDSRTRDAWLGECRRRTAFYYDGGGFYRHHRHHDKDRRDYVGTAPGYDYCEAYFDDYYRTYRPTYAYAQPVMAPVMTYQTGQRQVSEVVTERYEPIRSRIIPRRRVRAIIHDKRIRVAP